MILLLLLFCISDNASSERIFSLCIFVAEKLTSGTLFKFSTIINDTDLHVYSTLHRHMSGCNAAESLRAVIPPSLVLDLHVRDTSSKNFYPAQ